MRNNPKNAQLIKVLDLERQFAILSEERGVIQNSKIGRVLGLSEEAQIFKAKTPKELFNTVFKSPQAWQETQNILNRVNPELIDTLRNQFRAEIFSKSFSPLLSEVTFPRLQSAIEKFTPDVIQDVLGQQYVKTLDDAALITRGLESTLPLKAARTGITPEQKLVENIRRTLVHPLAGKVGVMAGIMSKARNLIGLGAVSDKDIFRLMQGERGQRVTESAVNVFLNDPSAYNAYVQVARELNKLDNRANPVDESSFNEAMLQALDGIANITGQNNEQ